MVWNQCISYSTVQANLIDCNCTSETSFIGLCIEKNIEKRLFIITVTFHIYRDYRFLQIATGNIFSVQLGATSHTTMNAHSLILGYPLL